MKREIIKARSSIKGSIREFFTEKGYLEVETPVMSPFLIPESSIEVFQTEYFSETRESRKLYLTPSPEVFMKKMISDGSVDIFQMTKSFRNYEQSGKHHNPEFTMLEWYTMGIKSSDNIEVTEALFEKIIHDADQNGYLTPKAGISSVSPPFRKITMEEIFYDKTGIDLSSNTGFEDIKESALKKGYTIPERGENWESVFNRIFLTEVEPFLPDDKPLVIYNYPSGIECLAADVPGTPWKDRWELYCTGIELANCYTEETDRKAVSDFIRSEHDRKLKFSRTIPAYDPHFISIFSRGFPECSGVALGVDRLIQIITGTESIEGVILFPLSDIL